MNLLQVKIPKVHPNIIGPGLAQFPVLDISGSHMLDSQRGTFFFSILDTKKVQILSLQETDLTRVNFMILATAISTVQSANLSKVRVIMCVLKSIINLQACLTSDQVEEILKRSLASKTLKYLHLDEISVPDNLKHDTDTTDTDNILEKAKKRFNIYTKSQPRTQILTSAGSNF